ncbi:PepSY domain-containing protein [Paenibacillus sp. GSMTC-2017]|uniref:PepSY domain-containing protein n=1 Tax=Paenibacillus sp. GSMTC-2017 TaxID=2794350 RepID=UPI0018D73A1E|nr:PepSY domain-containing protein [Paenibacillus sp. GSMTC-2017]MBH5320454.1 PepSY domain-containing protein [Paenibacillus sp. GSMTC-2017]
MMKTKLALVGALSVAVLIGGVIGASAVQPTLASGTAKKEVLIGVKKAKEAATKVVAGRVESVELEREGGRVYYEVEIETTKKVDYDVLIDAYTGATLSSKLDDNDDDDDRVNTTVTAVKPVESAKPTTNTKPAQSITAEQAGKLAAAHVGGTVVKVETDRDDGRLIYEVKLTVNGVKTEVDVLASSGKIIDVDRDDDRDDDLFDNDDQDDDDNDDDDNDDLFDNDDQDDDNDDDDRK